MKCQNCSNPVEYNDEARQYICSACGVVLGIDLDLRADQQGRLTGERIAHAATKADQMQVEMQTTCERLGMLSAVPHALHLWNEASRRIYKSTPAAKMFMCGCLVIAGRTRCEDVLMAAKLQPSPEHIRLLIHTIKKIKRAVNHKASSNIAHNVRSGTELLIAQLDRLLNAQSHSHSNTAPTHLETVLGRTRLDSVRTLALGILAVADRSGYLKNRRRSNPIAVSNVVLSIEAQIDIIKLDRDTKVDLIKLLSSLLDNVSGVSLEAVSNHAIELLNLLRKISRLHTPWVETHLHARHKGRGKIEGVKHRYKSMVWVADVVAFVRASSIHTEDYFTADMSRSRFESKNAFASAAIAFVKDNQQGVMSHSASLRLIDNITQEFTRNQHQSRTQNRNVDDISDSELFSDDELASYIRTEEEVVTKQLIVGDKYDHQPKSKRLRANRDGGKRTKAIPTDKSAEKVDELDSDISEEIEDMINM